MAERDVALLFEEHGRMVLGLCRLLLRDPVEAEDATQQTFLSAHRSLLNGSRPRAPAIWLSAIARHECQRRSAVRTRAHALVALDDCPEPTSSAADPPTVASEHENLSDLRDAIGLLPPRQRQAVVLRHFYGLSYGEVAAALQVTVPVVEQLLVRARRALRRVAGDLPKRFVTPVMISTQLRDDLVRALPGVEPAASSAGAGVGGLAAVKLASAPALAKVAAVAAVAIGAGAGLDRSLEPAPHGHPVRAAAANKTPVLAAPESTAPGRDHATRHASTADDARPVVVERGSGLPTPPVKPRPPGGHPKSGHAVVAAASATHTASPSPATHSAGAGRASPEPSKTAGADPADPASGVVESDEPVTSAPTTGEPEPGEPIWAAPDADADDSESSASVSIRADSIGIAADAIASAWSELGWSSPEPGASAAGGSDAGSPIDVSDPDEPDDGD